MAHLNRKTKLLSPLFFAIFVGKILLTNCAAQQNVLSYTPSIAGALVMGQGIDLFNVSSQGGVAFKDVSSNDILDASVKNGQSQLYISAITTEEQLQNSMGMSASANLSFWNTDISASFASLKSSIYSSNSLIISVSAEVDYGIQNLRKERLKLNDSAQALLDQQKYNNFFTRYGHHYINAIGRKQIVTIFISIQGVSEEQKSSFNAKFGVKTSFLFVKADVQTSINSMMQSNSGSTSVSMHCYYLGKNHNFQNDDAILGNLSTPATSVNLDNVKSIFDSYLGNLKPENASDVNYYLASYTDFGAPYAAVYDMNTPKFIQTVDLFKELHNLSSYSNDLKYLTNINRTNYLNYCPKDEKDLIQQKLKRINDVVDMFSAKINTFKFCTDVKCTLNNVYNLDAVLTDVTKLSAFEDDYADFTQDVFDKYSLPPYAQLNWKYDHSINGELMAGASPTMNFPIRVFHSRKYKILSRNFEKVSEGQVKLDFEIEILRPTYLPAYFNNNPDSMGLLYQDPHSLFSIQLSFSQIIENPIISNPPKAYNPYSIVSVQYGFEKSNRPQKDIYSKNANPAGSVFTYYTDMPADNMFYDDIHFMLPVDLSTLKSIDNVNFVLYDLLPKTITPSYYYIKTGKMTIESN